MKLLEIARRSSGNGITVRFSVSEFSTLASAIGDIVAQNPTIGRKEEKRMFFHLKKISEKADEFIRKDAEFRAERKEPARKVFYAEWDRSTKQ